MPCLHGFKVLHDFPSESSSPVSQRSVPGKNTTDSKVRQLLAGTNCALGAELMENLELDMNTAKKIGLVLFYISYFR